MLGCTGTGCFVIGIVTGFILAAILGLFIVFHFNPDARESTLSSVRQVWTSVKSGVDNTLDAPAPAGTKRPVEPQIPEGKPAPRKAAAPTSRSAIPDFRSAAPASRAGDIASPQPTGQPLPRARIEINL